LFLEPALELLGRVCRAVVQNQGQSMNPARQGFRDNRTLISRVKMYRVYSPKLCQG
jgi:hypothetical protein